MSEHEICGSGLILWLMHEYQFQIQSYEPCVSWYCIFFDYLEKSWVKVSVDKQCLFRSIYHLERAGLST